jgi:hypothetical protein
MEIEKFKRIDKGALIASFTVIIPAWGMQIREITYFEMNGKRWISFPSRQYKDEDEKTCYFPFISMEKDMKKRFEEKVLLLLQPFLNSNTSSSEEEENPFEVDF